jgi:hypothetical protein
MQRTDPIPGRFCILAPASLMDEPMSAAQALRAQLYSSPRSLPALTRSCHGGAPWPGVADPRGGSLASVDKELPWRCSLPRGRGPARWLAGINTAARSSDNSMVARDRQNRQLNTNRMAGPQHIMNRPLGRTTAGGGSKLRQRRQSMSGGGRILLGGSVSLIGLKSNRLRR